MEIETINPNWWSTNCYKCRKCSGVHYILPWKALTRCHRCHRNASNIKDNVQAWNCSAPPSDQPFCSALPESFSFLIKKSRSCLSLPVLLWNEHFSQSGCSCQVLWQKPGGPGMEKRSESKTLHHSSAGCCLPDQSKRCMQWKYESISGKRGSTSHSFYRHVKGFSSTRLFYLMCNMRFFVLIVFIITLNFYLWMLILQKCQFLEILS